VGTVWKNRRVVFTEEQRNVPGARLRRLHREKLAREAEQRVVETPPPYFLRPKQPRPSTAIERFDKEAAQMALERTPSRLRIVKTSRAT
jgi:hypothetical protein